MVTAVDVAIALAAAAALTYHIASDGSSTSQPSAPPVTRPATTAPDSARQLAEWARGNLPPDTAILTDPDGAWLLATRGFTLASTDAAACRSHRFVLVTPSLKERLQYDAALATCVHASFPVATVGSGASASELRTITSDPAATARARQRDLADRRHGGAALAANPAVSTSAAVRDELRQGRLDLRAQAVLAQIAGRVPLRIEAIRGEPAEARAGMPARTVVVRLADPARLRPLLANVATAYRPTDIDLRRRSATLTWAFRGAPPPVLN